MNPRGKTKREDLETSVNYRLQLTKLLPEGLVDERLSQLQTFIRQLGNTPTGLADLQRRTERFGDCQQIESETANQFYGRLRRWLDRDIGSQQD